MSILINGIKMPEGEEMFCVNIYPDGKVCNNLDLKGKQIATAVSVVRCKDCKYRPIDTGEHNYGQDLDFPDDFKCPCECDDPWYSWMPKDDWFCANGKRKEDE